MAFTNHFYNRLIRKYVSVFGSVFNKYTIERYDDNGNPVQKIPVPISYGPFQKFLARNQSDPNLDRKYQKSLPRMSFEMTNIQYDQSRKTSSLNKLIVNGENGKSFVYNPVPYILTFDLNILCNHTEDGTQIVEQILPFFQPNYIPTVFLIDGADSVDIPIDLVSVQSVDLFDDNYDSLRMIHWSLTFSMKVYFFGPNRKSSIIKFVDVRSNIKTPSVEKSPLVSLITIQGGLDANGQPTKDIDETINYNEINVDDDWDVLTQIHTLEELVDLGYVNGPIDPEPHERNGKLE